MHYRAHDFEHLMVIFFDILILDEEPVLNMKHYQRMHLLRKVVQQIPGRAELGERQVIAFAQRQAAEELRKAFARSISMRGEGLVMKPSDEPYFNFNKNSSNFQSCCIKLKKEYIGQFGDVGDFTVIGASYDAVKAKSYQTLNLQWTDFYIGCLENREGIISYGEKPRFVVVAIVSPTSRELMKTLAGRNIRTQSPLESSFDLRIEQGIANGRCPPILFSEPFVFDIRCFAFDKEGNTGFWTMRFPQVSKIHLDRSFMDTVSFEQLQAMAEKSRSDPYNTSSQEELEWVRKLEISDTHGIAVDASTQQSDALSITTPSITQDSETHASHSQISGNFANIPKATNEAVTAKPPVPNNFSTTPICRTIPRKRMSNVELDSNPVLKRRDLRNLGVSAVQNRGSPRKIMMGLHGLEPDPENWSQPLSEIINMAGGNSLSRQCYRRPSSNGGYSDRQGTSRNASLPIGIGSSLYSSVTNITHQDTHVTDGQTDVLNISTTIDTRTLAYNNVVVLEKLEQPCEITGLSCIFYQHSIALTPCVVNIPWLTENLLPVHAIVSTTSYNALARQNDCDRKARRMLLVERHRVQETEEAIQYIRELDMKRPSGSKAWIDIYDWHLLEHVKRLGKCGIKEDILRRYWIGTV
jgi:DNA ligase-4